jgi:SulP family sulfate permease
MLHAVFLLIFILLAAPLASYIPLAALAGILVTVAWNMAEKHEFLTLIKSSRGDAVVLLATFLLTIFRDLTEGIIVGFALGAVLFINRMATATGIEEHAPLVQADRADAANGGRTPYDPALATDSAVVVYRLSGAFFFGTASTVGAVLDRIADQRKAFVIDFTAVPFVDSTAANVIAGTVCGCSSPAPRWPRVERYWPPGPANPRSAIARLSRMPSARLTPSSARYRAAISIPAGCGAV